MSEALGRFAANEWMSGRIPWWNPYSGPGLPLVAEGQTLSLFLPFVFLLALPNGLFLLALALQEIAAFATYALLRRMELGRAAAWAGAALYCLNGTFAWLGDQPMMPIAFAPLLLLGIEMEWKAAAEAEPSPRLDRRRRGGRAVALRGVPGNRRTSMDCSGRPGRRNGSPSCRRGRRFRFAGRIAGAAATGVLLAAPYVVPFAHMLMVGDVSISCRRLDQGLVPADALAVLSMPYVLGPPAFAGADATGLLSGIWT